MHLERLDFTTLYACHALLCLVAGVSFLLLRPTVKVPGLRWIAASFFLDELFLLLLLNRNQWHSPVVYLLTDLTVLAANYCYYLGFARLIAVRARLKWIQILFASVFIAISYAMLVAPDINLRWMLICVATAPMHLLLAAQSGRHARGLFARKLLAAMELVMGLGATFQAVQLLLLPAAPRALTPPAPVQSALLFLQLCHEVAIALCVFLLVHERVTHEAECRAMQDTLPGMLNRKGMERELEAFFLQMQRSGGELVLALIDLDHFKKINDEHGHPAGDAALVELANSLTSHMRPCDRAGRFGGDEFLVLLPDATPDYAIRTLNSVRIHVSSLPGRPFTLSSGGTVAHRSDTVETMLARADKLLYQAKQNGRDCVLIA
ncbi:diguanylate cyclase [Terriglobus sp. RCC_193]|uniref:GGDEF domain-containing protein n=1 Tax=Terriglobus sp. RCC_193 TaxID=3239218 RepID=UPI0035233555